MALNAIHATLQGIELHYSKLEPINGSPSAVPIYVGQTQYDIVNNVLYIAIGISSLSDWVSQASTTKVVEKSTSSYAATNADNGIIFSMTFSGARTFTLPTAPINGFIVGIQDGSTTAFATPIVVSSGTNFFTGGGATYSIGSDNACVLFIFDFASSTWIVMNSFIGLEPTIKTLVGLAGSPLTIGTLDTNGILLKVNGVTIVDLESATVNIAANGANAIAVAAASIDFKISGVSKLNLGVTSLEVKKTLLLDDLSDNTKQLNFVLSGSTTATLTTLSTSSTVAITLTLPNITDTLVTKNTTDTFTNKSFGNSVAVLAGNAIQFNNSGNTHYTAIQAGATALNLSLTLPIVAPVGGQALVSTDTLGTLGWLTISTIGQQTVATAANINALSNSTTSVIFTGSTTTNLNGIAAGSAGQELILINDSSVNIYIQNQSSSATSINRIILPTQGLSGTGIYKLIPNESVKLVYDTNTNFWYLSGSDSGSYIPTISGGTGYFTGGTISNEGAFYQLIGNIMTVTGALYCTPPASTFVNGTVQISLPPCLINNFSFRNNLIGTFSMVTATSFGSQANGVAETSYICASTTLNALLTISGLSQINYVLVYQFSFSIQ